MIPYRQKDWLPAIDLVRKYRRRGRWASWWGWAGVAVASSAVRAQPAWPPDHDEPALRGEAPAAAPLAIRVDDPAAAVVEVGRLRGLAGVGVGRYASGQLPDATVTSVGLLRPLPLHGLFAAASVDPAPWLSIYAYAGAERLAGQVTAGAASNDGCAVVGGSCTGATGSTGLISAGTWLELMRWRTAALRAGVQYSYMQRRLQSIAGIAPLVDHHQVFASLRLAAN